MLNSPLSQRLLITLAVVTAVSILVHDTKFDKAIALALPVATITIGLGTHGLDLGGSAHTHIERASMAQAFGGIPSMQPRDDHRKYLSKYLSRRANSLGTSQVLWPSV